MTLPEIHSALVANFSDAVREFKPDTPGTPFITIEAANIKDVCLFLRDEPGFEFDSLMCLSGVDYGNKTLGVTYHLDSTRHHQKCALKVVVPIEKPEIPTCR